ncbi:MAG: hypothetical protein ABSH09_14265 [Bryobacteraceae bacterium]
MFGRFFFVLASGAVAMIAAQLPIGILTTIGAVRMDNAEVRGTGTVLEGSVIETSTNPAQLTLKNGTRCELSPDSKVKVYDKRILLEKGASQFHSAGVFPIVVNSLSVAPTASSTIRVYKVGPKTLEVSAVSGQAEVRNASGLLIARVFPGSALDFDQEPGGGATAPEKVSGKVEKSADGHYYLTDVTTKTTFELVGDNLDKSVGSCVAVTGTPDANAATQIHVMTISDVPCKKLGLPAGAAGGAAAGASTGLSTPAIIAIIGGVAVGGSLGGAAAAGVFSGGSPRTISGQ